MSSKAPKPEGVDSNMTTHDMSDTSKSIHFVSLGCPKNRVDSEVMLGVANRLGYVHVDDAADARVVVVNTCGFIDAAKQESINTILELAQLKETGACQQLVVTGCLSQRYPQELAEGLPEVDHFLGSSDALKLEHVLGGQAERNLVGNPADWLISANDPRVISTRGASAFVKLAEGCNRTCSFCTIPQLRGVQRSRSVDDVVLEVEQLCDRGVLEINLISQDTVAYGRDRDDGATLAAVVRRLAEVRGLRWLRLHYLYPETLTDELVELLKGHDRVLPYIDMPLQHAADSMLRRMRRGHGGKRVYQVIERLKTSIPDVVLRTAFIIGHPGETDADFEELCQFVKWAEFNHMGVFHYSDEPGTHSHEMSEKVEPATIRARARKLMTLQRKISRKKNRALIGQTRWVLVEGPSDEGDWVMEGRHSGQAPDIDGKVFLSGDEAHPGTLRHVTITDARDYDLLGELSPLDENEAIATSAQNEPKPAIVPKRKLNVVSP
jgi:ribosomal protein S12 methylthiotransferase